MPLVIKNYFPGMLHQEVYKKRIKITYAGLVIGQKQKLSHDFETLNNCMRTNERTLAGLFIKDKWETAN